MPHYCNNNIFNISQYKNKINNNVCITYCILSGLDIKNFKAKIFPFISLHIYISPHVPFMSCRTDSEQLQQTHFGGFGLKLCFYVPASTKHVAKINRFISATLQLQLSSSLYCNRLQLSEESSRWQQYTPHRRFTGVLTSFCSAHSHRLNMNVYV